MEYANFSISFTTPTPLALPNSTTSPVTSSLYLNVTTVPSGCVSLQVNTTTTGKAYIPWNNSFDPISLQVAVAFGQYKALVAMPVLSLVGVPANVVSLVIFARLGLRERINLLLFSLALCDLVFLAFYMLLYAERIFSPNVRYKLLGFTGFAWGSQFLSAVIASERCLCIFHPMKARVLLPTKVMGAVVVIVVTMLVGFFFVISFRYTMVCVYNPATQVVTWQPGQSEVLSQVTQVLEDYVYGIVLSLLFTSTVTISTLLTSLKLRQVAAWRASTSSSSTSASARELALTKMLVLTSFLFMACYLPNVAWRLTCLACPEYNIGRLYHNTYQLMVSVLEILGMLNASANFFIYLAMGSRFRQAFFGLFCGRKPLERDKSEFQLCTVVTVMEGLPQLLLPGQRGFAHSRHIVNI